MPRYRPFGGYTPYAPNVGYRPYYPPPPPLYGPPGYIGGYGRGSFPMIGCTGSVPYCGPLLYSVGEYWTC